MWGVSGTCSGTWLAMAKFPVTLGLKSSHSSLLWGDFTEHRKLGLGGNSFFPPLVL